MSFCGKELLFVNEKASSAYKKESRICGTLIKFIVTDALDYVRLKCLKNLGVII